MRSLGLEGKVGASAIVRGNPLLRKYDEEFVPVFNAREATPVHPSIARVIDSFLPFSWYDVLGVVRERYAGRSDEALGAFLSACARTLPNRVFTYDLDTPHLSVILERHECTVTGVLSGSCDLFLASGGSFITGHATAVWARPMVIGTGNIENLLLYGGVGVLSPICAPHMDRGSRQGMGSLITPCASEYPIASRFYAFHPDNEPRLRALYDRALGTDPCSPTLPEEMRDLHNEYLRIQSGLIAQRRGASR